jgi:hypothetical protein
MKLLSVPTALQIAIIWEGTAWTAIRKAGREMDGLLLQVTFSTLFSPIIS